MNWTTRGEGCTDAEKNGLNTSTGCQLTHSPNMCHYKPEESQSVVKAIQ